MSEKHPLQRLASPSTNGLSPMLHLLGLSSFTYSFKFLFDFPTPINGSYGWHFQYLTILGLSIATLTFLCGIIADVTTSPHFFHAKNILSICSTPLEVLISVLYWTLRTYDKSVVIPDWAQLPLPADIAFHATPSIVLTLDFLLLSPPWSISATRAMGLSTVFAFSYWFWIEHCFKHNGFYPYPIFEMVGTAGRVGLFTLSAMVMTGSTVLLKKIYEMVNRGMKGEQSGALDEGTVQEQVEAYVKEGKYIAKAHV